MIPTIVLGAGAGECPQGAAANCQSLNANFQRGRNFGQPNTEGHFQTPHTLRVSVGLE